MECLSKVEVKEAFEAEGLAIEVEEATGWSPDDRPFPDIDDVRKAIEEGAILELPEFQAELNFSPKLAKKVATVATATLELEQAIIEERRTAFIQGCAQGVKSTYKEAEERIHKAEVAFDTDLQRIRDQLKPHQFAATIPAASEIQVFDSLGDAMDWLYTTGINDDWFQLFNSSGLVNEGNL